ncbi:MAG: protein translocase subunit SecD [Lachnospiraceae bacterium]|uniref:Multifunctional fusion protein n=1 Tax=Candidatus Weimeria bifida TaxID=2599074 RepID=A0A6N7J115_9FIRM|nr:protein translocase subunit SecD [Candidatus Weimeria bifida]RRF97330.1 MAG: protein translocase subunit SecD [Lachnospiraceae bacterium]
MKPKKGKSVAFFCVFLAVVVFLGWFSYTVIKDTFRQGKNSLKLGLDLAGGASITYQIQGKATKTQINDTIYKLQKRIENDLGNESNTTEANVYQVGSNRIAVEIPGVKDANAVLEQLGTPGDLYFIKHRTNSKENYVIDQTTGEYKLADGVTIKSLQKNGGIVLNGSEVKTAQAVYEQNQTSGGRDPVVSITLTSKGAKAFATATTEAAKNNNDTIGIYYDGKFVSVPKVNSAITDGNCVIEGMSGIEEAQDLASYIRIGGLDIKLKEVQSHIVGAQLGSDALKTSLIAAVLGFLCVVIFMIAAYKFPGAMASLALLLYAELILSILQVFDITLTISGIAGIILSIGMAVDANVIIFSRMKEEIAAGKTVRAAIDSGFRKALSAIIDGNITTLIVAVVLGVVGTGTIKGFAITLGLGTLLSMFTALFVTRSLVNTFYNFGAQNPKIYGKLWTFKKIPVIEKKAVFFAVSIIAIGSGIVGMIAYKATTGKALNYSLDFSGGTSTTVNFKKDYTIAQIDKDIVPVVKSVTKDSDIQRQKSNSGNQVIFKTRTLNLSERENLQSRLEKKFGVKESDIQTENISGTISGEMRRTAVIAVIISVILILIYIWFRFRDIRFATSAVLALAHDVLVTLGIYALFRLSVGSAFVACILTIIGYSINDTIVVFDRIRENFHNTSRRNPDTLKDIADTSITEVVTRSLSTSFTTALTIIMLLIVGVSAIREFAFPLLIGVISGTYSSIFVATPLWYVARVHIGKQQDDIKQGPNARRKKKKPVVRPNAENHGAIV